MTFCSPPTPAISCHAALLQKLDIKSNTGQETAPCLAGSGLAGSGCGCPGQSSDKVMKKEEIAALSESGSRIRKTH